MSQGAVFLDRDGVITEPVLNPQTGEYESPHAPEDLKIIPGAEEALKRLQGKGFPLFLVSNQPSYAKGKTSLENIKSVHERLDRRLKECGVHFQEYYYCYHHPQGRVPGYSKECDCRKPKPFFLLKAGRDYHLDMQKSWMVGDRDMDMLCGQNAGCRTIRIYAAHAGGGKTKSQYSAESLAEAVDIILKESENVL